MSNTESGADEVIPQRAEPGPPTILDRLPPETGGRLRGWLIGGAMLFVAAAGGLFLWASQNQPAPVVQTVNPEAQMLVSLCKPNIQACSGTLVVFNDGRPVWQVTAAESAMLEWIATAPGQLLAIEDVAWNYETATPEFAAAYCSFHGVDCNEPVTLGTTAAPATAVEATTPPT